MPILGHALMPAAPCRPCQHAFHALLHGQHEAPEEAPNLPRHSVVQQSSRRLARRQAARGGLGPHFFGCLLRWSLDGPSHRPQRLGPPNQGAMPFPARSTAPCRVLQPAVALRLCTGPCHGPPAPSHLPHGGQRRRGWRQDDRRRQRRGSAQTPAYQEPAAPGRRPRRGQGQPHPVRPARPFGPVTGAQPLPALRPQRRQDACAVGLPPSPPDLCLPRDGPAVGVVLLCPPPAAAAQRHRRSRLSPTRRAPPHRRPAGACDAPGAGAGHKAARLVPQRAGHAPGRLSLLVVERGRGQARRGRPHARTPATPQCGHAPPGLLCPSTDAPPPPPAGPFCATRFPRGPAPRVDRL